MDVVLADRLKESVLSHACQIAPYVADQSDTHTDDFFIASTLDPDYDRLLDWDTDDYLRDYLIARGACVRD